MLDYRGAQNLVVYQYRIYRYALKSTDYCDYNAISTADVIQGPVKQSKKVVSWLCFVTTP